MTFPWKQHLGFTLIEMTVSLMIIGLITVGIGSSLMVARHALPSANTVAAGTLVGARAVEQLCSELQYAIDINNHSATDIEFRVADRDGDLVEETIRYAWSGVAGDPLRRHYNGATGVSLVDAVQTFQLSYNLHNAQTENPTANESALTNLVVNTFLTLFSDFALQQSNEYGVYFKPALAADVVTWKVTQVRFEAKAAGGNNGVYQVQLQLPTQGKLPSGIVLQSITKLETGLSYRYNKVYANFTKASELNPDQGLCLLFNWSRGTEACCLKGRKFSAGTPDCHLIYSNDKGVSWTSYPDQCLSLTIIGTVTTSGTPQVETLTTLHTVDLTLNSQAQDTFAIRTAIDLLHQPEVTP